MKGEETSSFKIRLPIFEGPFDLLLFFIERDELDIHDIPIAKITNDFLDYIHHLEILNIEVASEFILVAATLMRIKAKVLLPHIEVNEKGEIIDPREDLDTLIQHVLEYKKYKSVVQTFADLEWQRYNKEKRGNLIQEIKKLSENVDVEAEIQELDLFKLLKTFQKVIQRIEDKEKKVVHKVVQYKYTIEEQKKYIINSILKSQSQRVSFLDLMLEKKEKIFAIFNFLAILELIQIKKINIIVSEGYNNFWIERF